MLPYGNLPWHGWKGTMGPASCILMMPHQQSWMGSLLQCVMQQSRHLQARAAINLLAGLIKAGRLGWTRKHQPAEA